MTLKIYIILYTRIKFLNFEKLKQFNSPSNIIRKHTPTWQRKRPRPDVYAYMNGFFFLPREMKIIIKKGGEGYETPGHMAKKKKKRFSYKIVWYCGEEIHRTRTNKKKKKKEKIR